MTAKKKKKPKYNKNSAIRSAIRRAFSRSPVVQEVLKEARIEEPRYKKDGTLAKRPHVFYPCAICKRKMKSTDVAVDHIDPVIPVNENFTTWDKFVERLFCDKDNLQILCDYTLKNQHLYDNTPSCHYKKTREEDELRDKLNPTK